MGALCTFLTHKDVAPNGFHVIYNEFHIIFCCSPRCEMKFDVLRDVSLKQVHKRATQQMYFV